ncbi:MAG: c-type cytochrome [Alphaproteobacteria bacterium]|nr:c-type cytochrome [Alphaproteobacteria bacterium]
MSWLPRASAHASRVDVLFIGLMVMSALVLLLLFWLLLRFAIHYRAGNLAADRDHRIKKSWHWEVAWTTATLVGFLGLFVWGAYLFVDLYAGQRDALPVYVVAKQWMWKAQHLGGQREINELHVPLGHTIRLIMSSQDVIHSFFLPAFRIKHDVVPGTVAELSFRPEHAGVFHLFCAEYCGTDHARMIGRVVVQDERAFETWLARQDVGGTLVAQGAALYRALGCGGCHGAGATVRAPSLEGLYGKSVPLSDGTVVVADEAYLRDAILKPRARVVAGYQPLMPSYEGKISEDELIPLVAYLKSLAGETRPP